MKLLVRMQNGLPMTMIKYIFILIFTVSVSNIFATDYDSLLNVSKNDSEKVTILLEKAAILRKKGDSKSDSIAKQALNIAKKSKNKLLIADANSALGLVCEDLGDFESAERYFNLALQDYLDLGLENEVGNIYNNFGSLYYFSNNLVKAAENWEQALKIFIKNNDSLKMAATYSNLGIVYDSVDNFDLALKNFEKAADIFEKKGKKIYLTNMYVNISIIEKELEHYQKSIKYLNKAIYLKKLLNDEKGLAVAYNNMASVYVLLKENKKAEEFFKKAINIKLKYKDIYGLMLAYKNLADFYINVDEIEKAKKYTNKGMELCNQYSFLKVNLIDFYQLFEKIYKKEGNIKEAKYYKNLYKQIEDSLSKVQDSVLLKNILSDSIIEPSNSTPEIVENKSTYKVQTIIIYSIIVILLSVIISLLIIKLKNDKQKNQ